MLLKNKTAVVAGVANKMSIGWGIGKALHEHGAKVAFMCLESNVRRVNKMAAEIGSDAVIPCNALDEHQISAAFQKIGDLFDGKLDIFIHSLAYAKIDDLNGEFISVSREGWNLALEVSAYSLVAYSRLARPLMKASGGGAIIALTHEGGEKVAPNYNIMGIAKAALNMTVKYLAYDLGHENIRVNAISPGPVKTLSSMMVKNFDNAMELNKNHSSLCRNITAEDINGAAVFLASDLSGGITGEIIKVTGGMSSILAPSIIHPMVQ